METTDEHSDTEPCVKCQSQIPVNADRCRECGYEPRIGLLGGAVMWVSGMVGSLFLLITVVSVILVISGDVGIQSLSATVVTGFISAVLLGIVYMGYKGQKQGPTDEFLDSTDSEGGVTESPNNGREEVTESLSDGRKQIGESWQEGRERGDAIGEKMNAIYYTAVHSLPTWLWTVGILLGSLLSLAAWPAGIENNISAVGSAVVFGGSFLFIVIATDALRLNDLYNELSFRWWFWSFLSLVPLFGWIIGFGWLWRRRSKTKAVTVD